MSRRVSDWIDGFMELTENSEPPKLFRKWTAISAIASAMQRKVKIDLGVSLRFYPNLYIVLVGPSATGKGTSMKFASDILSEIGNISLSAQATSLQALIRKLKDTNHTDIDPNTNEQIFHSSLTIFSNEFTVFLGYHNRELISALCDWYDCPRQWSYDTIKRDRETVNGCWVNLLAGTTPDTLQSSLPMEAIGGGLTSRIIFVNEYSRDKIIIFPGMNDKELQLQQDLTTDLEVISMIAGSYKLTDEAMEFYSKWVMYSEKNPPFHDKKFDGYCGRRRKHLLTISIVCAASHSDELLITKKDMERAADLLYEVEVKMGTVFRGMGQSDISTSLNEAIRFFELSSTDEVPVWQFARHFEGDVDKLAMDRILTTLEASKYIQQVRAPGKDTMIRILDQNRKVYGRLKET